MIVAVLNFFFTTHLLLLVGGLTMAGLRRAARRGFGLLNSGRELRWHYGVLAVCLGLPFVGPLLPGAAFEPIAKIDAAADRRAFDARAGGDSVGSVVSIPVLAPGEFFSAQAAGKGITAFFLLLIAGAFVSFVWELEKMRRLLRSSYVVRHMGRVRVAVSDRLESPLSIRFFGAWVLIPESIVADPVLRKISLLHELQHHRQRDTRWVFVTLFVRRLFVGNPGWLLWEPCLTEIQELACDENLVDQDKIEPREYARGLIAMAETAVGRKERFACAAGLAFQARGPFLSRRIENMFTKKRETTKWAATFGVILVLALTTTALAAGHLVADHRVSLEEGQRLAEQSKGTSDFPVAMNERVLKQLNRFVALPQGRSFMRASLERMETYRPLLQTKISEYKVPEELMAVALVESGYRNLPQSANKAWGAGLWMFIESTARTFGMKVDDTTDERLNVEKETDAALRYLAANQLRFKDWGLAIMAYNMGEQGLQAAMEKESTRDPWALIQKGHEGDKDYLAKVMAATIILKNPSLVN